MVNDEEVEDVEKFELSLDKEVVSSNDIKNRLQMTHGAFQRLWKVWAAGEIGTRTKICLFKLKFSPATWL